jgi:hypothetical protein
MLCFFFPVAFYSLNIDLLSDTTSADNMAYGISKGIILFLQALDLRWLQADELTFNCGKHNALKFFANPFL